MHYNKHLIMQTSEAHQWYIIFSVDNPCIIVREIKQFKYLITDSIVMYSVNPWKEIRFKSKEKATFFSEIIELN